MKPVDYKRIILVVSIVLVSTLTWAVADHWLAQEGRFTDLLTMILPSLAFILLVAVAGVAFMLLEHKADRLGAILASWATFIFFWPADVWYVSILPLFVLCWYIAARDIRNDLSDRRKLRVRVALGHGAKYILFGAFFMVSLGYFLLPPTRASNITTVSEDVKESVDSVYDNVFVQSQLAGLPAGGQAEARRQIARSIDDFFHGWLGPVGPYVPPLLAFFLFLGLWSVNFIFRELGVFLGMALWKFLKAIGFVTITEGTVSAEIITL